jgi:hypothetical protein
MNLKCHYSENYPYLLSSNTSKQQRNFISQTKYIREMLKTFGIEDCKSITTPMKISCKLRKYDDSKSTDQRK